MVASAMLTTTGMITFQNAGKARDRPSNVVVLQTTKKFFSGFLFFFGPQACAHFRDIDRIASQKMPLFQKIQQKFAPATLVVESVNYDAGVQ